MNPVLDYSAWRIIPASRHADKFRTIDVYLEAYVKGNLCVGVVSERNYFDKIDVEQCGISELLPILFRWNP